MTSLPHLRQQACPSARRWSRSPKMRRPSFSQAQRQRTLRLVCPSSEKPSLHERSTRQNGGRGAGAHPPNPGPLIASLQKPRTVPGGHRPPGSSSAQGWGSPPEHGWMQDSPVWQVTSPHANGPMKSTASAGASALASDASGSSAAGWVVPTALDAPQPNPARASKRRPLRAVPGSMVPRYARCIPIRNGRMTMVFACHHVPKVAAVPLGHLSFRTTPRCYDAIFVWRTGLSRVPRHEHRERLTRVRRNPSFGGRETDVAIPPGIPRDDEGHERVCALDEHRRAILYRRRRQRWDRGRREVEALG